VNTSANTVTCTTNNFSSFALFAQQASTPPSNTNGSGESGGFSGSSGSVTSQVASLLAMGNTKEAATLMQAWPNLFPKTQLAIVTTPSVPASNSTGTQSFIFTKNLTFGAKGADVTELQQKLITQALGPAAQALAKVGATGYFGPLTKSAVIEYQKAKHISPAVGYFGPLTRASVNG
jgi:hypothetical protein